jgi:hypothetical protein
MVLEFKLGMASEMVSEMVADLELQMASELLSEGKLIWHVCFEEIHIVGLAPLFICLLISV